MQDGLSHPGQRLPDLLASPNLNDDKTYILGLGWKEELFADSLVPPDGSGCPGAWRHLLATPASVSLLF